MMKDAEAARRAHHQQRLDLGPCAAAAFGALYRDQARHHRPDQSMLARRPRLRHRLRPDRYRQCRDADDREDADRRHAGRRHHRRRADASTSAEVAEAVVYMAGLPLDANVQFMTVMATKMPFIGRG